MYSHRSIKSLPPSRLGPLQVVLTFTLEFLTKLQHAARKPVAHADMECQVRGRRGGPHSS